MSQAIQKHVGTLERRFNEGTGTRYLKDGKTVRCQGRAKGQLNALRRRIREELHDTGLSQDDIDERLEELNKDPDFGWPETQCTWSAVPGAFGCSLHGGDSPGAAKTSIVDWMPVDLQEVARELAQNPEYASQQDPILVLQTRNAELLSRLHERVGGKDLMKELWKGLEEIRKGEVKKGADRIAEVLYYSDSEENAWNEVRANLGLGSKLVETQLKVFEKMKQLATTDQVMSVVVGMSEDALDVIKTFVADPQLRSMMQAALLEKYKNRTGIAPSMGSDTNGG